MFDKFTERARKVMMLARQEAQRHNSEFIGTEHILLGIIQEGGGVANKVLKAMKVDTLKVRAEVEKLITPSSSPTVTLGQLPFSPRAKRVFELANEAMAQLGNEVIGTEHLLLALLKENEGIAAQVLVNMGLKLDAVRDMTLEILGAPVGEETFTAGNYMITFSAGLSPKQIKEVITAVKMIKGVDGVEKANGIEKSFSDVKELIRKAMNAVDNLRNELDKKEEPPAEEETPPISPS